MYPRTDKELLSLMTSMMEFNPHFRPTAKECLQNSLFDAIRVPALETSAPFKINIDVDRNHFQFDYECEDQLPLNNDEIKLFKY